MHLGRLTKVSRPGLNAGSGGIAIASVCSDLPSVAPFVFDHAATIPIGHVGWLLESTRTGIDGASIRHVGVVDIHVEKGCEFRYR